VYIKIAIWELCTIFFFHQKSKVWWLLLKIEKKWSFDNLRSTFSENLYTFKWKRENCAGSSIFQKRLKVWWLLLKIEKKLTTAITRKVQRISSGKLVDRLRWLRKTFYFFISGQMLRHLLWIHRHIIDIRRLINDHNTLILVVRIQHIVAPVLYQLCIRGTNKQR
jgi:hypothetical protein